MVNFRFQKGDVVRRTNGNELWEITAVHNEGQEQLIEKVKLGSGKTPTRQVYDANGFVLEYRPSTRVNPKPTPLRMKERRQPVFSS